ncbi:hypothetical protein ZWY2020_014199 [Hordeum vulgare]|nr:hypothetical protein ZWY2020_014199 [Hordeum vulgare]
MAPTLPFFISSDSSGGDDGASFPNGASSPKPVSTATSFVAASSNHACASRGPFSVKAAFSIAATSFVAASSNYGGDSDSDSADTASTRRYNQWNIDDNIHLVQADGRLLREYGRAHVPPSALLREFLNGRSPIRHGKLTARIIGDKRRYLQDKFFGMCKGTCKRKNRKPRARQERALFKCCMQEWPHIMEEATAELEDQQ